MGFYICALADVWSDDVNIASLMESSGSPGRVHISETTAAQLGNEFSLEASQEEAGFKTYFVERSLSPDHVCKS